MNINKDIEKFSEEGYVVINFYNTEYLEVFQSRILKEIKKIIKNDDVTLETFHAFVNNDDTKFDIQFKLNKMIWDERLHEQIIKDNIKIYNKLIGRDLDIQTQPYLRIARPNCPQDNIGFHRDGFYGSSAYELSTVIPLVDLNENSSLQIEPGSHTKGPIPVNKVVSDTVVKGDKKNQLGFQYAPKIIDQDYEMNPMAIPLKFKEALSFGLGTIHGQEVNTDFVTRFSMDVRVKNSFIKSGTKEGYYRNLALSPISQTAKIYYENNPDE